MSKIGTRILASRLQVVLLRLIYSEKARFIKGCDISDQVSRPRNGSFARQKGLGSNVKIKLDNDESV